MWQQMRHELLPELSGYSLAEDNKRPREYSSEREKMDIASSYFFAMKRWLAVQAYFW